MMATKAELQAELAELKREMAQREQLVKSDTNADQGRGPDTTPDDGSAGFQRILDDLGLDSETLGALKETLMGEVTELQKEKPMIVLAAAFALGVVVGRATK